jgi:hypothetical protein
MKIRILRIFCVAAAALGLTLGSYLSNNNPTVTRFGWIANTLDAIQLPAVLCWCCDQPQRSSARPGGHICGCVSNRRIADWSGDLALSKVVREIQKEASVIR